MTDEQMESMVSQLDDVIKQFPDCEAHNIAGVLLSRVTLLLTMDPSVGKHLLQYVWQQLDEIEQADPGSML